MEFEKHYFTEEQLDEFTIGKDSYFTNILRKAVGSAKRKINPKALETTELSPAGYTELFNLLTNKYTTGKKSKYHIKDLFQGVFNPKNAQGVFGDIDVTDKKQIEVVSYFKTSNGGAIALYNIKDDEDNEDKYFIGIDGKGQKYFAARPKEGGIGMLFKAWLSAQKANKMGVLGKGLTPDKKKPNLKKIQIDKDRYLKIAPEPKKVAALAASTSYDEFLNRIYEDDLPSAAEAGMKRILGKDDDGDKENKPSEEEKDAFGELFYEIRRELKSVNPVKPTDKVKYGWRYITDNGGIIFVYEGKDDKYYIAFDKKGEKVVKKYNLIDKYDLEIADAPE